MTVLNDCMNSELFVIDSLDSLLLFTKMVPLTEFLLAEDIVGKNNTVLVRKGQELTSGRLDYLKTHESYVPRFVFQRTDGLSAFCTRQLRNSLQQLIASRKTAAMTYAVTLLGKDLIPLLNEVFQHEELVYTLFSQRYLRDKKGRSLFEHLILCGILNVCLARIIDPRFKHLQRGADAMIAGLLHDIALEENGNLSADAQEEKAHGASGAKSACDWGFSEDVVFAIRHHHNYCEKSVLLSAPPSNSAAVLRDTLNTCECYLTLIDRLPNDDRENQALFLVANYGKRGRLNEVAVNSLGEIVRGQDILTEVERIVSVESECVYGCAYAHPKHVHSVPTSVVCKGNHHECPLLVDEDSPLLVVQPVNPCVLKEGFLSLLPGSYPKCSLGERLTEVFKTSVRATGKETEKDTGAKDGSAVRDEEAVPGWTSR